MLKTVNESIRNRKLQHSSNGELFERTTMGLNMQQIIIITKALSISNDVNEVTIGPYSTSNYFNDKSPICSFDTHLSKTGATYSKTPEKCKETGVLQAVKCDGKPPSRSPTSIPLNGNKSPDESFKSLRKLLLDVEQERLSNVKEAMRGRVKKMEEVMQAQRAYLSDMQESLQKESEAKFLREELGILRQLQEDEVEANQRQQQLEQQHKHHAQRLSDWNQMVKDAEQKQRELEEERKRKLKERAGQIGKIWQCQVEYGVKYQQISELVKSCKDKQLLGTMIQSHSKRLSTLDEALTQLVKQCEVGEISSLDLQTSAAINQQMDSVVLLFKEEVDKINASFEEAEAKERELKAVAKKEIQALPPPITIPQTASTTTMELNEFTDKDSFQNYLTLQQSLQAFEASFANLISDDTMKKFRFDCQKAVNIPVNAISPVDGTHLQDKLVKLIRLLSGQPADIGQGHVTASAHPQGIAFCKSLLAKKLVHQGGSTVSSKPEAAFAFAAVIVAVWVDFPDFGEIVLAYFHRECPYLVPMFLPQVEGQSKQDYYRTLGYKYSETGEVEKQGMFLKRMSGIMRLYAAVLITTLRRQQQNKPHPHGLAHAWRWVACMLNMDPRPDISATLMFDFLEVTGNLMHTYYGKQFQKLLHLISKVYFLKIEQVTPASSVGPMVRLETFLQEILKQGRIPPPKGVLPSNFW